MKGRRRTEPEPLKRLIPGVLKGMKPPGRLERVRAAWPEVVGPVAAARTRVLGFEEGRVRVEVASAPLKHDLQTFRRDEVLEGLKKRLPDLRIRDVRYVV